MAQFQPTEAELIDLTFAGQATGDMTGDVTSAAIYINGTNNYCLQYVISDPASQTGTMELLGSNVDVDAAYVVVASQDVIDSTTAGMFNVDKGKYRYVKLHYTAASGAATLSGNINLGVS